MILLRQVRKLANFEIDLRMPQFAASGANKSGSQVFEAGKAARNCWVVTDFIVNTADNGELLK